MQIYDVTNPQAFVCQSKADVKCKQYLLLLKIIYSLLSYLFCFHTSDNLHATLGKPKEKEMLKR